MCFKMESAWDLMFFTAICLLNRHVSCQFYTYNVTQGLLYQVEVHKVTGDVYISGQNILVHLSPKLQYLDDLKMGPVQDNKMCSPHGACDHDRILTDNHVMVLEINPVDEYLLVCGSTGQGICSIHTLNEVKERVDLNTSIVTNYLGSRNSTVAFFGIGDRSSKILYTAMSYDNRPWEFFPKSISTREVHLTTPEIDYWINKDGHHSFVGVHPMYRDIYHVHYVAGFEYSGYTYFIAVRIDSPKKYDNDEWLFLTKIIQICQDDVTYSSYTEIPLSCVQGSSIYNLALSAYLSTSSEDHTFHKLYVSFGKNNNYMTDAYDSAQGSVICSYSLQNVIIQKFDEVQDECYSSGIGYRPTWINPDSRPCISDTISHPYCGSVNNIGIQTIEEKIQNEAIYFMPDSAITSLVAIDQYGVPVIVMGTNDGYLQKLKIKNDGKADRFLRYPITPGISIQSDVELDRDERNLYILSGNQVMQISLYSCEMYTSCYDCVKSDDPLQCGWCNGICSLESLCIHRPVDWGSCPPIINSISPTSGPVDGSTLLTIIGKNYGSSSLVDSSIRVGSINCTIMEKESNRIVCRTGESETNDTFDVHVSVFDGASDPRVAGSDTMNSPGFTYKIVSIAGFYPEHGPVSGGTNVTITGQNLDVGSHVKVLVIGKECTIIRKDENSIVVQTGLWIKHTLSRSRRETVLGDGNSGRIEVNIDGAHMVSDDNFTYKDDATITSIVPNIGIRGGGINLTISGQNLDVVARPRVAVTVSELKQDTKFEDCTVMTGGKTMLCPLPSISNLVKSVTSDDHIMAVLWFEMDGIESVRMMGETNPILVTFSYFPDPEFYKFTEDDYVKKFNIKDDHLILKGNHLNKGITTHDVNIRLGNSYCNVTEMKNTKLLCQPMNKPETISSNEPKRKVEVRVGYLHYDSIGFVVYTDLTTSDTIPINIIILALVLGLVLVAIIVLVIIMKRKHVGPFKESKDKHTIRYEEGRPISIDGLTFDMGNRNNQRLYEDSRRTAAENITSERLIDEKTRKFLQQSNLLIDIDWLILGDMIGEGHFGRVMLGELNIPEDEGEIGSNTKEERRVAVKTLHKDNPRDIDIQAFLEEALIMKDFHHKNVLTLIGVCLHSDDMPLVILPFMKHGDLLTYIRNDENNPTIKDLISYGLDICYGMEYLAELKFIHRDLAARNCMLDEEFTAKVADFGLSRDVYETQYYVQTDSKKTKLPVKWMAMESLEKGTYSIKSDVWSFGIVLWELMTRGVIPYPEVGNWDLVKYLKAGRRMAQPQFCPDQLYKIMRMCWSTVAAERPTFYMLVTDIVNMIDSLELKMKQGKQTSNINSTYVNLEECSNYHYTDELDHGEEAEGTTIAVMETTNDVDV